MKHLTIVFLIISFHANAQTHLFIKAGTNFSSYLRTHNDGWQFGPYLGFATETQLNKCTALVFDAKLTRKGSKASGRWVIPETNNLNTDYLQVSTGLQFRPFYHLSISLSPYAAYMLQAKTGKWNYEPYKWNINFMRRLEYGGELWAIYHFKDINGAENIFSIQGGWSMAINRMASEGFEMHPLRNKVASLGFGLKIL